MNTHTRTYIHRNVRTSNWWRLPVWWTEGFPIQWWWRSNVAALRCKPVNPRRNHYRCQRQPDDTAIDIHGLGLIKRGGYVFACSFRLVCPRVFSSYIFSTCYRVIQLHLTPLNWTPVYCARCYVQCSGVLDNLSFWETFKFHVIATYFKLNKHEIW